jgi:hypothetical protein
MNLAVVIVIAAAISLVVILRLAVTRSLQGRKSNSLATIQPIDMEGFRNLINPAEDDFLRRRLPSGEFRPIRRLRLRAMAAYVEVAAGNAEILVRAGETALASGDLRTAEAARELVNQALLLRRNTTIAMFRIYLALAWPYSTFAAIRVIDRYEQVSGSAMLLGRLQNPGAAVRLRQS